MRFNSLTQCYRNPLYRIWRPTTMYRVLRSVHGSEVQITMISVHLHERMKNVQRCQTQPSDGIMTHLRDICLALLQIHDAINLSPSSANSCLAAWDNGKTVLLSLCIHQGEQAHSRFPVAPLPVPAPPLCIYNILSWVLQSCREIEVLPSNQKRVSSLLPILAPENIFFPQLDVIWGVWCSAVLERWGGRLILSHSNWVCIHAVYCL